MSLKVCPEGNVSSNPFDSVLGGVHLSFSEHKLHKYISNSSIWSRNSP